MKPELTIEHLAPYLPYGLKCYLIGELVSLGKQDKYEYAVFEEYGELDIRRGGVKPILRPLSDLTKEIEHEGVKFVPRARMEQLLSSKIRSYDHKWHDDYYNDYFVDRFNIRSMNLIEAEKLFEWHFDVFYLIGQGLAIDINQVDK